MNHNKIITQIALLNICFTWDSNHRPRSYESALLIDQTTEIGVRSYTFPFKVNTEKKDFDSTQNSQNCQLNSP